MTHRRSTSRFLSHAASMRVLSNRPIHNFCKTPSARRRILNKKKIGSGSTTRARKGNFQIALHKGPFEGGQMLYRL